MRNLDSFTVMATSFLFFSTFTGGPCGATCMSARACRTLPPLARPVYVSLNFLLFTDPSCSGMSTVQARANMDGWRLTAAGGL
jgi:hypothetical protein